MSNYIERVLESVRAKNHDQPEFLQAVSEVLTTLRPVLEGNAKYEENAILECLVEPERIIMFSVPWILISS